ncbi:hypothetical protein L9F63_000318 [Diploptera punctata]|uniref:Uncharacterized protein n=1 Tax=Diploptera punctata TaxID=6984 RepID=A0AAD8AMR1_DIPPU|nr:hypothetical protein L9F63_000318 [Diploptera punctata]
MVLFGWIGSKIEQKLIHFIILASMDVGEAAYDSGWEDAEPSVKQTVCIIMVRAQKPAIIRGGQFYITNLETVSAVSIVST